MNRVPAETDCPGWGLGKTGGEVLPELKSHDLVEFRGMWGVKAFRARVSHLLLVIVTSAMISPWIGQAMGTWVPLANVAPSTINLMLLLSDGSVMAGDAGGTAKDWYRLTPDSHGSYVNGTWTQLASMHDGRDFYPSQVLTNGDVFVAGGEAGGGANSAEVYDPQLNNWLLCPGTGALFSDSPSEILPDGNVLLSPVGPPISGQTMIYNPNVNSWIPGPMLYRGGDQDEASWVKLADGSILTIDPFGTNSERYVPSLNQWIDDADVPVPMYEDPPIFDNLNNLGAALLLPNKNGFFLGASGNTAIYVPSSSTNPGTWLAGPVIPSSQGTANAPAAMMVNGKILCMVSPIASTGPQVNFYEYDPIANTFSLVGKPQMATNYGTTDSRMVDLPDGNVLFTYADIQLYEYQPDGTPLSEGQPRIISITTNYYGSYHLTGTLLNGISEGAAYGNDSQMNSNYPLIRMTNILTGIVYYARTYNWSSTGVMTGTNVVSTDFKVPTRLPGGSYSLVVVANGNSSIPVPFTFLPDALSVTFPIAFVTSGPIGGSFNPNIQTYWVTNTGASLLNCSVINTSTWLNVDFTNFMLAPAAGSGASVSVASEATNLTAGVYRTTLIFSNGISGAVQLIPIQLEVYLPLQNGGFESGSFADWDLSPDALNLSHVNGNYEVFGVGQDTAHSGNYSAFLGFSASPSYLAQTIPTVPGNTYLFSYYVNGPMCVGISNDFSASWNGTLLFDEQQFVTPGYTNMNFIVQATNTSSTLEFNYYNNLSCFILDDVSLTSLPATMTVALQPISQQIPAGGSANLSILMSGSPPFSYHWQNNGTNLSDTGSVFGSTSPILSVSNALVTDSGNYRVVVTSGSLSVTSSVAELSVVGVSPNCGMPAPTGLISWWPGDSSTSDLASTNNGIAENGVGYAPGEVGYAFTFNGINQFVFVPGSPSWSFGTNEFTMEAWANFASNTNAQAILANDEGGGNTRKWIFEYNGSAIQLLVGVVTNGGYYISSTEFIPNLNQWYHIALTRSGSLFTFYINGNEYSSSTSPVVLPAPNAPLTIGNAEGGFPVDGLLNEGGFPFNGMLDDVRIYSRSISALEIQSIYSAGTNGMCAPSSVPSLLGSQPLDQNLKVGQSAYFSVTAECSAPFVYQWLKNGQIIPQANGSDLTLKSVLPTDGGEYNVIASNQFGMFSSRVATLSVSTNCVDSPPSGLVSWWTAENNANDFIGNNNGVLLNGGKYAKGEVGNAFNLSGSNQYVNVYSSSSLSVTGQFTIVAWINRSTMGTQQAIVEKYDSSNGGYALRITDSDNLEFYSLDNSYVGGAVVGTTTIYSNQFYSVVGMWNGSNLVVFVNGNIDGTWNYGNPPQPGSTPLRIGARGDDTQTPFAGLIDEVQIYNRALSTAEIQAIYQAGTNGMCAPTPLMFTAPPNYNKMNAVILSASLRSGQNYNLQTSTNLVYTNWITLTNFTAGSAPIFHFTNQPILNTRQQFFRITSP